MTENKDILKQIGDAETLEQTAWIITDQLLSKLPELREAVLAVAVPHWFNQNVLKALIPDSGPEVGPLYEKLLRLSFVETHGATQRYRLHELTRKAVIGHLETEESNRYKILSQRAKQYFESLHGDRERIEAVYHDFNVNESDALEKMIDLFWDLDYREEITAMSLLVRYVGEHKNRLSQLSRLWWRYLSLRVLISDRKWEEVTDDLQNLYAEANGTPIEPWIIIDLSKMRYRAGEAVAALQGYQQDTSWPSLSTMINV